MKQFISSVVSKFHSLHVLFILLFSVLLSVSSWLIWNQLDFHVRMDLQKQYQALVQTTTEQAAQTAKPLLESNDRLSLQVYASESIEKRQLDSITFYGPSQQVLAYANRKGAAQITQRVTSSSLITSDDATLGSITVVMSTQPIEQMLNETTSQIVLIASAVWVLGIILMRALFHFYEVNVSKLAKRIQTPKKNDVQKTYFLELSPLEQQVTKLEAELADKNELNGKLNTLLNQQAMNQISKESERKSSAIQTKHASVVYIQARGLNQINQQLSENDGARLISEYVNLVQQAAKLYNGFVQVQANGLIITFGAPQTMNEHCLHAVCAANFLMRLMNHFNNIRQTQTKPLLKFQMAIHSGDVYCFDTPEQASMAIFGETIFEAAQLASYSKSGQLLLSEQARNEHDLNNKVSFKGPYNLGNGTIPMTYQVDGLEENYDKLIDRQVKHISSQRQSASTNRD